MTWLSHSGQVKERRRFRHASSLLHVMGDDDDRVVGLQLLNEIFDGINEVVQLHGPEIAAVEDVFLSNNPRSALKLGQARGAAIVAAMQNGLAVRDYSARMIKQAVVGYGQAEKIQVQHMVRILLGLSASPSADAADALAVAICHANTLRI